MTWADCACFSFSGCMQAGASQPFLGSAPRKREKGQAPGSLYGPGQWTVIAGRFDVYLQILMMANMILQQKAGLSACPIPIISSG